MDQSNLKKPLAKILKNLKKLTLNFKRAKINLPQYLAKSNSYLNLLNFVKDEDCYLILKKKLKNLQVFYILLNNNASLLNDLLENIDYLIGDLIKSYTDKTFDNIIHPRMNQKILTFNDIQGYLGNIRDLSEVRSAKVDQNLSFCNINTSSGSRRIFWPVKYYYPIDEKKGWQDSLKIAEIKVPSDYKLKFPENDNLIYGKLLPLFDISDSMQLNMNSNSVSVICNECNSEFDESEFEFLNISDDEVISSQKKINNFASESYEATALKRNSSSKLKTDLREEIEKEWDFC
ncbi:hypothetical protein HDU92_005813 [Lobulomyces angularis]|nr:hypothetical protein HDU92_005813 [Lobulomyces angularis]